MVLNYHPGIQRREIANLNKVKFGEECSANVTMAANLTSEQSQQRRRERRPEKCITTGAMINS